MEQPLPRRLVAEIRSGEEGNRADLTTILQMGNQDTKALKVVVAELGINTSDSVFENTLSF